MEAIKIHIVNLSNPAVICGYGEGKTLAEAKRNALDFAKIRYPKAKFNKSTGAVEFSKKVRI